MIRILRMNDKPMVEGVSIKFLIRLSYPMIVYWKFTAKSKRALLHYPLVENWPSIS